MKKLASISIVLFLAVLSFMACGEKKAGPKAGSASPDDMLSLLPDSAIGIFFVDFKRVMATEIAAKSIKEDKNYEKYQDFIEKTGIDPQKDVYFVVGAITKTEEQEKQKGVGIVNLKYNKETLLSLMEEKAKEEGKEVFKEDYNGKMLYAWKEDSDVESFSFIDDSNIIVGNRSEVKSVIDVIQKKKDNMFKNEDLSSLISKTNKKAMLWGAFLIPSEAMSKMTSGNPMLSNLEGINAASMYFDYKNENMIAEIQVLGGDETKNQQIAEFLTGIKALGSMVAAEKPGVGELMNRIEITTGPDHVKIYASIPEELINELKKEIEKEKT